VRGEKYIMTSTVYNFEFADKKFSKRGLDSKIGLDRYSVPEHNFENYRVGDRVVAIINERGDKEIATIKYINRKKKTLRIKTVTGLKKVIDGELAIKPLELHPVQWWTRQAEALAEMESGDDVTKRNHWRNEFSWLLDGFRLSPGGRVMLALGQEYTGLTTNDIEKAVSQNRVPAHTRDVAPLTLYNCYVGASPKGATGYWNTMSKEELYSPKTIRIRQEGKNTVIKVTGSSDPLDQFLYVLDNAFKEATIMRRGGGYGINISYIETVLGAGINKDDIVMYVPETHRDYQEALDRITLEKFGQSVTVIHTEEEYQKYLETHKNIQVQDSVDGLFEDMKDMVINAFNGIKTVLNWSDVRHRNAIVKGVNGRSSGAVSWAEFFELLAYLLQLPQVDAVDFAEVASSVVHLIQQGGSRRGALMLVLETFRTDILEKFINRKKEVDNMGKGKWLTGANISLGIDDTFMTITKEVEAIVEKAMPETLLGDEEFNQIWANVGSVIEQAFNQDETFKYNYNKNKASAREIYRTEILNERFENVWRNVLETDESLTDVHKEVYTLWMTTVQSAFASAEPGIIFLERYNKQSNSWYFHVIVATNPCGEQGLPEWGVCNLAHIVLPRFYDFEKGDMNWSDLERAVRLGIRAQDLIIDYTPYFLPENEAVQTAERRIGQGTIGLGSLLVMMGVAYGKDAVPFIHKLFSRISFWQTHESALLAKEKGAFPAYDAEKFQQSGHIQQVKEGWKEWLSEEFTAQLEELQVLLDTTGIRNVTLSTQAPTGSTGTMLDNYFKENNMFDITTGIEPFFDWTFWRAGRLGIERQDVMVTKRFYAEHGEGAILPSYFVNAQEHLQPEDHIYVQGAVQYWTDSSISKTANTPTTYTVQQVSKLYMFSYDQGLKGMTIYRDGSRKAQVLSSNQEGAKIESQIEAEKLAEIKKAIAEGKSIEEIKALAEKAVGGEVEVIEIEPIQEESTSKSFLSECPVCGEEAYDKVNCTCNACGTSTCGF
jgi:ribonucleotide reductase alpha subunit